MKTLLLASFSLLGAAAHAQIPLILDQQPVGNPGPLTYNSSVCDADTGTGRIADGFSLPTPGEQLVVGFSIWGCWAGAGAPPTATDTFDVGIHEQTFLFGIPSFAVPLNPAEASFPGLAPTAVTATGNLIDGYDVTAAAWGVYPEYRLDFTLPTPVSTVPGCYTQWISFASVNSPNHWFNNRHGVADPNGNSSPGTTYSQSNGSWSPPTVLQYTNRALQIQAVPSGNITLCVTEVISPTSGSANYTASIVDAPANSIVVWLASTTGAGPIPTPWGTAFLTPPLILMDPFFFTDNNGAASVSLTMPSGFAGLGVYLYFQGLDLSSATLTTPVAKLIH